jgi:hypothetical protein
VSYTPNPQSTTFLGGGGPGGTGTPAPGSYGGFCQLHGRYLPCPACATANAPIMMPMIPHLLSAGPILVEEMEMDEEGTYRPTGRAWKLGTAYVPPANIGERRA